MSQSLDQFAAQKLAALDQRNLLRTLVVTERVGPIEVMRGGKLLIAWACNEYLNLSQHEDIKKAAMEATGKWGGGAGASRLVTGNHPLFAELEEKLAKLKGAEAACVFGLAVHPRTSLKLFHMLGCSIVTYLSDLSSKHMYLLNIYIEAHLDIY